MCSQRTTQRDFLYPNAPLVEVLCDIRWPLTELKIAPGSAIDPHFEEFQNAFQKDCQRRGYSYVEQLIPAAIPREIVPHQPFLRFRRQPNTWPLFQVGPGILTINQVPEYNGWASFVPVIKAGLEALIVSHPGIKSALRKVTLELRYVNAFVKRHGMETPGPFIRDLLQLGFAPSTKLLDLVGQDVDRISFAGAIKLELQRPDGSAFIEVAEGAANDESAVVVNLMVRSSQYAVPLELGAALGWLEGAHSTASNMFQAIISDELRNNLGPPREI